MSTALYRRYRPESFADVIGQEHVTEPLMTALEKNRVNHAYLFSGPRGCGKTTSARILARCLNCAQGPTPNPCGVCESCVELSRDGGGSLDVIEMDAASHGGVDHARDLRERATFAPVRDRYKIFIIDEAHMVTREGFNALLKIVEEPPEHIKFIFATTEPNKVLGTIRSRTHHYPFRLVPPETLGNYLNRLCAEEGVQVADGVLPLVVRAGGGSVRDSLSILDQLMAGAAEGQGISYNLAVALLGFTHGELLDEVLDAFTSGSAATVFTAVDRVIQTGQDPRRFVEDLLERFRDLIIVKAVPDSAATILRGMAEDQLDRMRAQAEKLGPTELTRAADVTNEALNEMSGAVNPQLHLELLCARILVAATDTSAVGLGARLDQLERRLASGDFGSAPQARGTAGAADQRPSGQGAGQASQPGSSLAPPPSQPANEQQAVAPQSPAPLTSAPLSGAQQAPTPLASAPLTQEPTAAAPLQGQEAQQADAAPSDAESTGQTGAGRELTEAPAAQGAAPLAQPTRPTPGENTVDLVQNSWSDVLAQVPSSFARAGFAQCEPVKFENNALFIRAEMAVLKQVKDYLPQLQNALDKVLGLQVQIRGEVKKPGGGSAPPTSPQPSGGGGPAPEPQGPGKQAPIAEGPRGGEQAWAAHGQPRSTEPPAWSQDDWNNPVTSWNVAQIPAAEEQLREATAPQQPQPATLEREDPHPPTTPHLRVIKGEADPVEVAKAHHPSSRGAQERHGMSVAPDVTEVDDGQGEDTTAEGQQGGSQSQEGEGSRSAASSAPDYADYDGGYFDDAPQAEPEYVAGVGYVQQEAPEQRSAAEQAPAEDALPENQQTDTREREPQNPDRLAPLSAAAPLAAPGAPLATPPATPDNGSVPAPEAPAATPQQGGKLSFRERHAAHIAAGARSAQQAPAQQAQPEVVEEFSPSEEDVALESTVLIGQRAVEKILGGRVIEEQPLHQP